MSKTPYEIRLDVLGMAKDMLTREDNIKETHGATAKTPITPFTDEQLITRATSLYAFVNNDKPQK